MDSCELVKYTTLHVQWQTTRFKRKVLDAASESSMLSLSVTRISKPACANDESKSM